MAAHVCSNPDSYLWGYFLTKTEVSTIISYLVFILDMNQILDHFLLQTLLLKSCETKIILKMEDSKTIKKINKLPKSNFYRKAWNIIQTVSYSSTLELVFCQVGRSVGGQLLILAKYWQNLKHIDLVLVHLYNVVTSNKLNVSQNVNGEQCEVIEENETFEWRAMVESLKGPLRRWRQLIPWPENFYWTVSVMW